ncbi:MAG: TPM domain-containing protein [Polyangia bacterium]
MRAGLRAALAVLLWLGLAGLGQGRAAAPPIPPAPTRWVTDTAGFLSPAAQQALDARLESYQRATGHQVVVFIGGTLGDRPIEEWSAATFAAWRLGRKGIDDGLALFVFTEQHKLSIEVGYGLEEKVPDLRAAQILNEVLAPRLRAGERDTAITAGVDALLATIDGRPLATSSPDLGPDLGLGLDPAAPPAPSAPGAEPLTLPEWLVLGGFLLGFVALLVWRPSLALWILSMVLRGGRRSGGGGGGGGFGGGGGRSGGGGARGAW